MSVFQWRATWDKKNLSRTYKLSRLWVGRQKEPILGYVPKNDKKRIHAFKGYSGRVIENKSLEW